jgi:hypothetical protein
VNTSSTGKTRKLLMSMVAKMRKEDKLLPGTSTMELTRDGRLSILIRQSQFHPRDLTKTSVSTLVDHSTSYQDFQ